MEDQKNTNAFDNLLKQTLENSQMPVPPGIWESVGASLSSQIILSAKVVSLKLLLLKSAAGLILAGTVGFGIYTLLHEPIEKSNSIVSLQEESIPNKKISIDSAIPEQTTPNSNSTPKHQISPSEQVSVQTLSNPIHTADMPSDKLMGNSDINHTELTLLSNPAPISNNPVETKKEKIQSIEKTSTYLNTVFPEPANVFTPDGDGINDYFYIEVENEKVFNLQIFDDQGQKVFETTDKNKFWDGKNRLTGEPCVKGTYIYTYYYELHSGFKKKDRSILTIL